MGNKIEIWQPHLSSNRLRISPLLTATQVHFVLFTKNFLYNRHIWGRNIGARVRGEKKQSRIQPIEAKETREEPENDHLSFRLRLNISHVWILTSGLGSYMQQRTRSQTNKHPPNHSHPFLHLPNCDSAVPPLPLHHTPSDPPCRFNWCVNFCAD